MMSLRFDCAAGDEAFEYAALQAYKTVAIFHKLDFSVAYPVTKSRWTNPEELGGLDGG
jgi:hypothetical protein